MGLPNELSVNLGLPNSPEVEDPKNFYDFLLVYNAIKNVAAALDEYTGAISPPREFWTTLGLKTTLNGMARWYGLAYENLVAGNTVGFFNASGIVKARKAIDGGTRCRGFVLADVSAGGPCEVILIGRYLPFAPGTLTAGTTYYQSSLAGQIGALGSQAVGFALSDTVLFFNPAL